MEKYLKIIQGAYTGYFSYFINEMLNPSWHNYFYWLLGASFAIWLLEIMFPWRKNQPLIREHFGLDAFYLLWNYFLFSLIAYNALSMVGVQAFKDFLGLFGITNIVAINIEQLPFWSKILLIFVFRDFMQWAIHRLLHNVDWMWEFHKVHHSTEEMGFAALLRYHWMETLVYKTGLYIVLSWLLNFKLEHAFLLHAFTILIGHLNHANIALDYGPLKYLLNNPKMHIWHHAKQLPTSHPNGINFGITLSLWDYLFGTSHIPSDGRDIDLGFDGIENYPDDFIGLQNQPFKEK